jgi:hypothetical protein
MSQSALIWRHVTISAKSTWLHGDARGFRSRQHRIHSSGDYRIPPPKCEHAALHDFMLAHSSDEARFPRECRPIIGRALLSALREAEHEVRALAVARIHAHLLTKQCIDPALARKIIGEAKRKSSRALKNVLPGEIWSAGGSYKPVWDDQHLDRADAYILYDQGPDAWTWSNRDESDEGMFGRTKLTTR